MCLCRYITVLTALLGIYLTSLDALISDFQRCIDASTISIASFETLKIPKIHNKPMATELAHEVM
jgi:hypothetical protein